MIDLKPYLDRKIRVYFVGGREISGTLKGADVKTNLVLVDAKEYLRNAANQDTVSTETRDLDLIFIRGSTVLTIVDEDGFIGGI